MITYRAIVYPSQCDAMGHLNVQHYTAIFDQSMWHLVAHVGFRPSWVAERREGWADVRYLINFHKELRAGELLHTWSKILKIGRTSLVTKHIIYNTELEVPVADVEMTSVYFDLERRKSREIPDEIRKAAERHMSAS